jgi:tyrocidine synthetase-3
MNKELEFLTPVITEWSRRCPGKTAIKSGEPQVSVSYLELEQHSNRIANFLHGKIVNVPHVIILLDRSPALIASIIGVLKCGLVFVPVDPFLPAGRVKKMLEESRAQWVITASKYYEIFRDILQENENGNGRTGGSVLKILLMDTGDTEVGPGRHRFYLEEGIESDKLTFPGELAKNCYIYFTSGSTGVPKAVLGRQSSLVHFIRWEIKEFGVDENFKISQFTSPSFDPFLRDIFLPLMAGGTCCIPAYDTLMNMRRLIRWVDDNEITLIHTVPSLFKQLVSEIEDDNCFYRLKYILLAGELLRGRDISSFIRLFKQRTRLVNLYGPTETTMTKLFYRIQPGDENRAVVPVGKPMAGAQVLLLDSLKEKRPMGKKGEIYIRTPFRSAGYYNDPGLTTRVFLKNPYGKHANDLLYKTGDLGRQLADGNIELSGRVDFQVKIRGMRIEVGEIENRLLAHPEIRDTVVTALENESAEKNLCAYVIPAPGKNTSTADLKKYLSNELPDYMIPVYFVQLERFPLTSNGKIDRKALPAPVFDIGADYVAPRDEIERKLVTTWSDVLRVDREKIGIRSNFFQLGGHSLRAAILISRIHKEFHVNVSIREVFNTATIQGLSAYIRGAKKEKYLAPEPVEKKRYYPLSSVQERLYFLQLMEETGTGYNMPRIMTLEGTIAGEKFEDTFSQLIRGHESLRSSFIMVQNQPFQQVLEPGDVEFAIEYEDIDGVCQGQGVRGLEEDAIKHFIRAFDLSRAPLLRVGLIKMAAEKHLLVVDMHHIIADGTSLGILMKDFMALYEGRELAQLRLHYKDYSQWEKRGRENIREQETSWLEEFSGEIPVLDLPLDYVRPKVQSFEGNSLSFELDSLVVRALKELALKQGTTFYMVLLCLYNIFLYKLSQQETIVVGTPSAGRHHADLEQVIGMFVNTLALKNYPCGEKSFRQFLAEVKEKTLKAFANQGYQYEELVEKVMDHREANRNPLFDTMFVLQNLDIPTIETPGLKLGPYPYERTTAKFDLTLLCIEYDRHLTCLFEYSTRLFKQETIERFILYLKNIIAAVKVNPGIRLADIDILSREEKRQLVLDFNDTSGTFPTGKTIYRLFAEQVDQHPDHVALAGKKLQTIGKHIHLTFKELDKRANQLAHYLGIEKGVRVGDRVAVLMERSLELIISLIGVMKAGAAYVPLDPTLPGQRLRVIFNDASIGVVITQEKFKEKLQPLMQSEVPGIHRLLCIDGVGNEIHGQPVTRRGIGGARNPAYVMYTSGSSGTPKGVLVEHQTIVNTLDWRRRFYEYGPGNVSLQVPPYFFDSSVTDIFTPLLGGARLVLVSEEDRVDLVVLKELITGNKVSHFIVVPAFYNVMLEEIADNLKSVKMITCAGEHFPDQLIRKHFEKLPGVRIFNEYGPTENSVNSTVFELEAHSSKALIGKPISNVKVHILDRYLRLNPIGVTGEICLSGSSLARGYLNRPELTAEKFVINSNSRFYRTGDMGKWSSDGNLEFLGRIDTQVKIRGIRVETGEIENHLMGREDIKEAVVLAHEGSAGEKYLCAYVVPANVKPDADADLKLYLSGKLPEYMIPSHFIGLDAIPFTPTGKINREALPEPKLSTKGRIAPGNRVEERLAGIWAGILDIQTDTIGSDSDFFQLGGHSLKATTAASRIHKAFNVKIPLAEIFTHSTLRGMAKYIGRARQERFAAIGPVEKKEYYPLSPAQKRLHLLQQMDLPGTAYNLPQIIRIEAPDLERFETAFKKLIRRHESLRTSFHLVADQPVQRVHEEVEFEIEYGQVEEEKGPLGQINACGEDLATENTERKEGRWEDEKMGKNAPFGQINACGGQYPKSHELRAKSFISSFIRPFDLSQAPLLRCGLFKLADGTYTWIVDMHHIITDGASHAVLKDEFDRFYTGKTQDLPLPRLQYKDYAQWQDRERQSEVIKRQETYWLKEFNGEVPVLQLPTDYPRPFMQSFEGCTVEFTLSPQESQMLKSLAKKTNTTLYMSILAVFNILLSKLSGQEDIIVGTPVMGRRHTDLERIIGIFVNTLAMRNQPRGEKGFKDFLSHVKERTLAAYDNQEYQFEDLVDKINVVRDIGRNPVFDVMFNLLNIEDYTYTDDFPGSAREETCQYNHRKGTAKFDLTLTAVDLGERLIFTFEYCSKLFEPNTIDRFISYFKKILASLSEDSARKVSEIDIITETEKQRLLYEFNDTNAQYPEDMTIRRWFEEQVTGTPDHVALIGTAPGARNTEGEKHIHLTYKELNRKSNRLAGVLRGKGVKTGGIVGLMVNRSIQMMVGLLAILKAGAAYLPIDSKHPRQRLEYMLRDSDSRVILTDTDKVPVIPFLLKIDPYDLDKYKTKSSPPCAAGNPTGLAYIIYTSGTTGKPKGVMIENRSLVNFIKGITGVIPFQESDSILSLTTISFDIFGLETILPLTKGSKVVIGTGEEQLDTGSAAKVMENENITIFQATPSRLQLFIMDSEAAKSLRKLKYLLVGGEALPDILLKALGKLTEGKIYNVYGPTETTIWSTLKDVSAGKSLNIGKPISNTYVYILSRTGSLQPLGVGGELCISGDGVARGYLNKPELTAEKFGRAVNSHLSLADSSSKGRSKDTNGRSFQYPITPIPHSPNFPSPHHPVTPSPHAPIYPTGDLARWLADGNIEFLGRMDFQVKIRGFRIELGEIENCIETHPGIKGAIVIDRNDNGRQYLCAYVTAAPTPGKGIPSNHELKEHLEGKLPAYMIPACFVAIGHIPLNPCGKIDRNQLPRPLESDFHTHGTYEAPVSGIQQIIAGIWREVLGREKVGIRDNFFDLGGNSLDFIKISNKLKEKLEQEIPVVTLFTYPTIRSLELYLTREQGVEEDDPGLIDEGKDLMQLTLKKLDNGD